jgi:hypothetical protein
MADDCGAVKQTDAAAGIYTVFIAQAYQMSAELLSTWCSAAALFSTTGAALSEEVTDGKINVQSACALHTRQLCAALV